MRSRITQMPRLAVTKVTPDCRGMMILLAFARSSKNAAIGSGDRQCRLLRPLSCAHGGNAPRTPPTRNDFIVDPMPAFSVLINRRLIATDHDHGGQPGGAT